MDRDIIWIDPRRDVIRISSPPPSPDVAGDLAAASIIRRVAARHGVRVQTLRGKNRRAPLVRARCEASFELLRHRKANGKFRSLPEVGRILGRHHSSIIHHLGVLGYSSVQDLRAQESEPGFSVLWPEAA